METKKALKAMKAWALIGDGKILDLNDRFALDTFGARNDARIWRDKLQPSCDCKIKIVRVEITLESKPSKPK
jgi:hypothetical protein